MTAVANAANRISPDETIQGIQAVLSLPDLDFHVPLARIYERTALASQQNKNAL